MLTLHRRMTSQQPILITDTNIWIDLGNGDLLGLIFHLPYKICIVDFARNEIHSVDVGFLETQGLIILDLASDQVAVLSQLTQLNRAISPVDFAAFLLAKEMGAVLVSGDRNLVKFATQSNVAAHGLLWLIDELVRLKILPKAQALCSLSTIISRGARLPEEECTKRYQVWSKDEPY